MKIVYIPPVYVSIHAPTRGATAHQRHYRGYRKVSIHAPTRGATNHYKHQVDIQGFQSTHPRGVRLVDAYKNADWFGFNPRTHEGCDYRPTASLTTHTCFNPRTHEGCDGYNSETQRRAQVSIHAPTRGATK